MTAIDRPVNEMLALTPTELVVWSVPWYAAESPLVGIQRLDR